MNITKLIVTPFFLLLGFIFLNIYQHNNIISMVYKKQRIDRQKELYLRSKNNLFADLYRIASQARSKKKSANDLGMKPLKIEQISTVTHIISEATQKSTSTDGILSDT
jgi:hypothetical protein